MNRFQRRLHLVLWLLVAPACLALLWLGLSVKTAGESDFSTTVRTEASE